MKKEHLEEAIKTVSLGEKLILVKLNQKQIERAKQQNGERRQISHALICGKNGQIFGTEKQCRKYYDVWKNIFPYIFNEAFETSNYDIIHYNETFDLVNILINKNDKMEARAYKYAYMSTSKEEKPKKKKKIFNIMMAIIAFIFLYAVIKK